MSKIVKIDLEGAGLFDRECARFIHDLVLSKSRDLDPNTLAELAKNLEIRPDRASRIVRRLGLRRKYDGITMVDHYIYKNLYGDKA